MFFSGLLPFFLFLAFLGLLFLVMYKCVPLFELIFKNIIAREYLILLTKKRLINLLVFFGLWWLFLLLYFCGIFFCLFWFYYWSDKNLNFRRYFSHVINEEFTYFWMTNIKNGWIFRGMIQIIWKINMFGFLFYETENYRGDIIF